MKVDNEIEDITKIVSKSNSKIDNLRENRVDEFIKKSYKTGKNASDGMIKEAEERKEKKRKEKKKKNADTENIVNDTNSDNINQNDLTKTNHNNKKNNKTKKDDVNKGENISKNHEGFIATQIKFFQKIGKEAVKLIPKSNHWVSANFATAV